MGKLEQRRDGEIIIEERKEIRIEEIREDENRREMGRLVKKREGEMSRNDREQRRETGEEKRE